MTRVHKRWTLPAIGRANLRLVEDPVPQPQPHEVLVRGASVSLNFHDKLVIDAGLDYPGGSFTPGSDLAGEVVAIGETVSRFTVGDRVIATYIPGWIDGLHIPLQGRSNSGTLGGAHPGVLAEYVALDQDWLVHAPRSLTPPEAACLPCAGVTAWFALVEEGHLQAGQSVLVHGTGGVSLFAMQIAIAHGAEVIVTSRSAAKLERVKALGPARLIDSSKVDWVAAVKDLTGGRGVDHVVETIGGPHLGRSLDAAAERGRVSLVGVFEGGTFSGEFGALALKHLKIEGIGVGHRRGLEDLVRAVDSGGIKPVIDTTYPFEELPAALAHLDAGAFGKVVVTF